MLQTLFTHILVVHVTAAVVGVVAATITDYWYILRNQKIEQRRYFFHVSNLLYAALFLIYLTGILLIIAKPEVLHSPPFLVNMGLVFLITINGFILHYRIYPKLQYRINLMKQAIFSGSLSVVSWYAIIILASTKNLGYNLLHFAIAYVIVLLAMYFIALSIISNR